MNLHTWGDQVDLKKGQSAQLVRIDLDKPLQFSWFAQLIVSSPPNDDNLLLTVEGGIARATQTQSGILISNYAGTLAASSLRINALCLNNSATVAVSASIATTPPVGLLATYGKGYSMVGADPPLEIPQQWRRRVAISALDTNVQPFVAYIGRASGYVLRDPILAVAYPGQTVEFTDYSGKFYVQGGAALDAATISVF